MIAYLPTNRDLSEILNDAAIVPADDADEFTHQRQELFADVADELREIVTEQPVVLFVEDMHWADQGTIDPFDYLVDEVGQWGHPVMFVGTYRTSDVKQTHPVLEIAETTAEAGRGTVIELEAFDEENVRSLLSYMLDVSELPESFTEAVYDHTGGTPLFVNELGRHLADTLGPVQTGTELPANLVDITVPETVEVAITERLDGVPAEVLPVLRLGTVIGQEFSFDLLREASERPVDKLVECSNTLVRRQVWEQTSDGIAFVHGIVRDQTLERSADEDHERLHASVADAIETVHSDQLDEYAGQLAYHYEQVGNYERAFECHRQAAGHATETYANDDAIDHYEQALELDQEHDVADESARQAVSMDLGAVFRRRGEYDRAREYYEESLRIAEAIGDRHREATTLLSLGSIAENRGAYEQAAEYYEVSLAIYREIENSSGEAYCLEALGNVERVRGAYSRALEYAEGSLDIFRERNERQGEFTCHYLLGRLKRTRGEFENARDALTEALELAREIRLAKLESKSLRELGAVACRQESYEQATEYLDDALDTCAEASRDNRANIHLERARLALAREDVETARGALEQVDSLLREFDSVYVEARTRRLEGRLAARTDTPDEAREQFREALDSFEDIGAPKETLETLGVLVETCREHGADEQARQYRERASAVYENAPEPVQANHGEWLDGL